MFGAVQTSVELNDKHFYFTEYEMTHEQIMEALGLLPIWVRDWIILDDAEALENESLKDYMDGQYGFGLYQFGGFVTDDGKYRSEHEDDEDLDWIGRMKTRLGDVLFYTYGIVAIPVEDGKYFITRMD